MEVKDYPSFHDMLTHSFKINEKNDSNIANDEKSTSNGTPSINLTLNSTPTSNEGKNSTLDSIGSLTSNSLSSIDVSVFWDSETCCLPSEIKSFQIIQTIKKFVTQNCGVLKNIHAFGEDKLLKTDLQHSGVQFHEITAKPLVFELSLAVEMIKLTCTSQPPHIIVLVVGNRDITSILNALAFKGYELILIHPKNTSESLTRVSTTTIEWESFLLKYSNTNPFQVFSTSNSVSANSTTNGVVGSVGSGVNGPSPSPSISTTLNPLKNFASVASNLNSIPSTSTSMSTSTSASASAPTFNLTSSALNNGNNLKKSQESVIGSTGGSTGVSQGGSVSWNSSFSYSGRADNTSLLKESIQMLKKESFKPTEKTIEACLKRILVSQGKTLTNDTLNDIFHIASTNSDFKVFGSKPKRVIYESSDLYGGIDPIYPPKVDFSDIIWRDLKKFLLSRHPVSKSGRYRFAEYLRVKGPSSIQELPLAKIAQLVELSIVRKILSFRNGTISSVADSNNNTNFQQFIPQNQNDFIGSSSGSSSGSGGLSRSSTSDEIELLGIQKQQSYDRVKNEIFKFLNSRDSDIPIDVLNEHLVQCNMIYDIKPFTSLQQFIEENQICRIYKEYQFGQLLCSKNSGLASSGPDQPTSTSTTTTATPTTLFSRSSENAQFNPFNSLSQSQPQQHQPIYTSSKYLSQVAENFVKEQGGRVNIGTLSAYLKRNGYLERMKEYGGMKKCLESTNQFIFESDIDNSSYVSLRFHNPTPTQPQQNNLTKQQSLLQQQFLSQSQHSLSLNNISNPIPVINVSLSRSESLPNMKTNIPPSNTGLSFAHSQQIRAPSTTPISTSMVFPSSGSFSDRPFMRPIQSQFNNSIASTTLTAASKIIEDGDDDEQTFFISNEEYNLSNDNDDNDSREFNFNFHSQSLDIASNSTTTSTTNTLATSKEDSVSTSTSTSVNINAGEQVNSNIISVTSSCTSSSSSESVETNANQLSYRSLLDYFFKQSPLSHSNMNSQSQSQSQPQPTVAGAESESGSGSGSTLESGSITASASQSLSAPPSPFPSPSIKRHLSPSKTRPT